MTITQRLQILQKLYDAYEDFVAGISVACARGCAACCTQNVTMTTLEGYRIVQHLNKTRRTALLEHLMSSGQAKRFRPAVSTNELAAICLGGGDPPDEGTALPSDPCPFLSNHECLIYSERPFGCRCFLSTRKCETDTFAVVDPFVMTVSTLFLQFVEHADAEGFFGNMTDVLLHLGTALNRKAYEAGFHLPGESRFAANRQIPGFLVPPEHREKAQMITEELVRKVMSR